MMLVFPFGAYAAKGPMRFCLFSVDKLKVSTIIGSYGTRIARAARSMVLLFMSEPQMVSFSLMQSSQSNNL